MSRFQVLSRTFVTKMIFYIGGSGGKHESFIEFQPLEDSKFLV